MSLLYYSHYGVESELMEPQASKSHNPVEIIVHKRDNVELSTEEIYWFIQEYSAERIPDYQAAAWAMAIYFNGMTRRETVDLTMAMAKSGDMIDLSDAVPFAVDKHSTGGVGDKTSLAVLPIVAACGVPVAKMSGRGLGHSGGTLDKLESFSGFRVEIPINEFKELARKNHLVIAGQTANVTPADKALYGLRDVTGTVPSMPLIASSVMSKKLAAGADAIVLDVKVGEGAFMPTIETARELAQTMVDIGVDAGKRMVAVVSDMNQPLGMTAGNALEAREAVETLRGEGPEDFREHCLVIASHMLTLSPYSNLNTVEEARTAAEKSIDNGSALEKLRIMIEAQGGNVEQVDDLSKLAQAKFQSVIEAPQSGYIANINARGVGEIVVELGGGRQKKGDPIDHAVGVETLCVVGDKVQTGDPLFRVHANDETKLEEAVQKIKKQVLKIQEDAVEPLPLFYAIITGDPTATV